MVSEYHRAAAEAITRFGGHVAKYLGDGVMAFSAGVRLTTMTQNARDGLAWRLSMQCRSSAAVGRGGLDCRARVCIDSGAVVVGVDAGKEADVFGDAPNIAGRVEAAAEPGQC
jgi:class 3 adenylate cyclase